MFIHTHPYQPFIPENATKLIVGTLPPPRFTTGDLKPDDVNFCYGSRDGMLWRILDQIFELDLVFENTDFPIKQRKGFLEKQGIGICDIVDSAQREKIDASDLGMQHIKLRDLVGYLRKYPKVDTLLFTGGNSKNGPEYFFRRHLREYKMSLKLVEKSTPKIHEVEIDDRIVRTVSLTAPTGTANIAVGSNPLYKQLKAKNPEFNTFDFRVMQYREFF
ncbi:uracil-DNA glycosylase family protein [Spongiivirga citrea]|uniref:Uracil-DNA glycosylase family protein n=1 Tax=Spongiivirga citrea TaxID=1481457 RepID=A0A6M0CKG2_9FLAO|nr:uracil-DNA glycosylase family protein [Spongiivirga citrea]NER18418.1 uracil-DNA glycosylase family protein [Spongiivirga citrea]